MDLRQKHVFSKIVLEEETRPDGAVVKRSVIEAAPETAKIWMKNSTDKGMIDAGYKRNVCL